MLVYHVDAFSAEPFRGNPAAVCLPSELPEADWMHAMAAEMNLPMTAFVVREGHGDVFRLRWFRKQGESGLCGHATLAAAHVLWECGQARPGGAIRFLTREGDLLARQLPGGWTELDFPAVPAAPFAAAPAVSMDKDGEEPAAEPSGAVWSTDELARVLGAEPLWVGRSRLDVMVEIAGEELVSALAPDLRALTPLLPPVRGLIVTSRGGAGGADFVSRFFNAEGGEDPVTGSAHCTLAPYWAPKLGKQELCARQLSERGGTLRVRVEGDRVRIAGQAVSILRGHVPGVREMATAGSSVGR